VGETTDEASTVSAIRCKRWCRMREGAQIRADPPYAIGSLRLLQRPVTEHRGLRIAMLAPPWISVPPPGYGGIESVVELLCEALVARGHEVTLFAAPGSSSTACVHPLLGGAHPDEIGSALHECDHVARAWEQIERAADTGRPFDVVHDHSGFTALAMADRVAAPVVHTVHVRSTAARRPSTSATATRRRSWRSVTLRPQALLPGRGSRRWCPDRDRWRERQTGLGRAGDGGRARRSELDPPGPVPGDRGRALRRRDHRKRLRTCVPACSRCRADRARRRASHARCSGSTRNRT